MDLFDMVRAAPPPANVRDPTVADRAKSEEQNASGSDEEKDNTTSAAKTTSLSSTVASTVFTLESESDDETAAPRAESPSFELSKSHSHSLECLKCNYLALGIDTGSEDESESKSKQKPAKASRGSSAELQADADDDELSQEQKDTQPPKTKAEQKMFVELPAKHLKGKKCVVRIKRLQQSEIDRLTTPKSKTGRKRGRKRKESLARDDAKAASPPKKQKGNESGSSRQGRLYVWMPKLENGSKQRPQTPPPPPPPAPKPKKSSKHTKLASPAQALTPSRVGVNETLIRRFGSRFFNCFVKIKRLKMRKKRSTNKSKSVSFSEAVEILGSKPRKSSHITSTPKAKSRLNSSVPTRLQRVDAIGNVLEDIELNSSVVLASSTPVSGSSLSHRSKSGRSSCNGGRRAGKLKRPSVRIPTTDLASLRIDDSHEDEPDAGDEYIVPNEVPEYQKLGVRRTGTPTPVKKLTVTTTVSDEEDSDGPEIKKPKIVEREKDAKTEDAAKQKKEQTKDKPAKKLAQPEKEQAKPEQEQAKPEQEQAKPEQEQAKPEQEQAKPEQKEDQADLSQDVEKQKEQAQAEEEEEELPKAEEEQEEQTQAEKEQEKQAEAEAEHKAVSEENALAKEEQEEQMQASEEHDEHDKQLEAVEQTHSEEEQEEHAKTEEKRAETVQDEELEPEPEPQLVVSDSEQEPEPPEPAKTEATTEGEKHTEPEPEPKPEPVEEVQEEQQPATTNKSAKNSDASASKTAPAASSASLTDDVLITDDILEIQTSLEDVRELHTPTSPMPRLQITEAEPSNRSERLESLESDSSFKSAHQIAIGSGIEQLSSAARSASQSQSQTQSAAALTSDPNPDPNSNPSNSNFNGSQPPAGDSSIAQPIYSPIVEMPNLDDDELGELVDTDS
ncbi:hypothetical protein KR222_008410 [Zaprionus bogoriensis]|nr:hypothetical protein KR222_008410 [Zaprionus bogoriensis]